MRVIRHERRPTVPQTAIFNESSILMFSAVTKSTPVIFSQVALKLMRILHDKNYQNWSSGFGETCLVRFLRSDRYSVWGRDGDELLSCSILFLPAILGVGACCHF